MKYLIRVFSLVSLLTVVTACDKTEYVHVGPNWDALNKVKLSKNSFGVKAKLKEKYTVGDKLQFTVTSKKDGLLWIAKVDPDDKLEMLYPNAAVKDNKIKANRPLNIPSKDAKWSYQADKPVGKSVVVFIVTTGNTKIGEILNDKKDMSKALQLVDESTQWGLDKHVIDVVE